MSLNIPPVTQSSIKSVEQGRAVQIATLAKILNIAVGNTVLAAVEKVEPITPQQREELLKHVQESLLQLNRNPSTPAAKAQITQLLEQQQLLNSAQLKLVHLMVNGRPLLAYTDKPLQPGQTIPIQLVNAQRLVQLDPALASVPVATLSANATSAAGLATPIAGDQALKQLVTSSLLLATGIPSSTGDRNLTTGNSAAPLLDARQQTMQLLAAALRNLLPQKDQPQPLYSALPLIQQLPSNSRHELLSNTLQQALKTLADQLRSPMQLSNPKLLQMIVKNSGVFFEHKLATSLPAGDATPTNTSASTQHAVLTNRLTNQDLKGALLQLLNRVNQDLSATTKVADKSVPASVSASPITAFSAPPNVQLMQHSLMGLLQLVQQAAHRPEAELSNKVLRTQLLMLLQQHALGSLAKIQLQQVHTLNHQQNQTDVAQPTQSWMFDIPIKHGHDVHSLQLKLEQDWVEDEAKNDEESEQKIRRWSVTLSFNLPDAGAFYAQLTVINDSVSAKLWAENKNTLDEAKLKLGLLREQLESQGVSVNQLQCVQGTPPTTGISLHYSLVDVTT